MGNNLRLNLDNPEDREWLRKKGILRAVVDADTEAANRQYALVQKELSKGSTTLSRHNADAGKVEKKRKYGNSRVFREGQWWDSEWEYFCWTQLTILHSCHYIFQLHRPPFYSFDHNGVHIARARFDFAFSVQVSDKLSSSSYHPVLADAKSWATRYSQRFRWQCAMVKAFYNLDVIVFEKNKCIVAGEIDKYIRKLEAS